MPAAAQSTFALSRIGQIHVTVEDLARAVRFYRETLGVRFLFEVPGMAFFDCDGVRLMLGVAERSGDARHASILYFRVGDIHQTHRTLADRGVRFEGEPHLVAKLEDHDLWMAFFRDSENNMMAVMSEVARTNS
ncbi:MAG TPA: VOC family protein [Gemmatimonadaceae bacterium]|nr:VOC family protein [Gemmatimonadaceae bacterium]